MVEFKTKEIIKNRQDKGRSYEKLYSHVESGMKSEFFVASELGLEFNSFQEFDKNNPHSFAYDLVSSSGLTFEVKHLHENNSLSGWLNVMMEKDKQPGVNYGTYPFVSTTQKYKNLVDYIVFVESNPDNIAFIFDVDEFFSNLKRSKFNISHGNSTHFINPKSLRNFKGKI